MLLIVCHGLDARIMSNRLERVTNLRLKVSGTKLHLN